MSTPPRRQRSAGRGLVRWPRFVRRVGRIANGDPTKARKVLGWKHKYELKDLVKEMVACDIELFERDVYLKKGGHKILHEQE